MPLGSEWMMLPRCSTCPFAARCRQRAIESEPNSINNLAYLTPAIHTLIRSLFPRSVDIQLIFDRLHDDSLCSDDKLKLQRILSVNSNDGSSAALEAIRTRDAQVKQQSSLLIPKENKQMIQLFIILFPDPSIIYTVALLAYNIYDMNKNSWVFSTPIIELQPSADKVVSIIAQSLKKLQTLSDRACQVVVFDERERTILLDQLTLASDNEQISECLPLLCSTDSVLYLNDQSNASEIDSISDINNDENDKKAGKTRSAKPLKQLKENEQEYAKETHIGLPYLISLHSGTSFKTEFFNNKLFYLLLVSYSSIVCHSNARLF